LALSIGLDPDLCGMGPKKHTLKKKPSIKKVDRAKNPTKVLWVKANPWTFIFNMKNILFLKYIIKLFGDLDASNEPDWPSGLNNSDGLGRDDDSDMPNDLHGLDNPDWT